MTNQQTASLRRGPGHVDLVALRERSCSRNPAYAMLPDIMAEIASPPLAPTLACAAA